MNEAKLRRKLEQGDKHTEKSIRSRISRANKAEEVLAADLDHIVADDDRMYAALVRLEDSGLNVSGNLTNAVRWYYRAINGRTFPQIKAYERGVRPR